MSRMTFDRFFSKYYPPKDTQPVVSSQSPCHSTQEKSGHLSMPATASHISSATVAASSQVEANASANLDTIVKRLAEQDKKLNSIVRSPPTQSPPAALEHVYIFFDHSFSLGLISYMGSPKPFSLICGFFFKETRFCGQTQTITVFCGYFRSKTLLCG